MNIPGIIKGKISGAFSMIVAGALFILIFVIDAARKNLALDLGLIVQLRHLFLVLALLGVYLFVSSLIPRKRIHPLKIFGVTLVTILAFLASAISVSLIPLAGFEAVELLLVPADYITILFASIISIIGGIASIIFLIVLKDLIFIKRRKGTKRNFIVLLVFLFATALSGWNLQPLESSTVTYILFIGTIVTAIANSFKFSWIVYLTKREKLYSIGYGFLLFVLFIILNIFLSESSFFNRSLLYYSYPLRFFVSSIAIFGVIYFGMSFVVSLFHLPTAEAFDRKRIELSSLHNLSRLITRVFDFQDLVQTVTNLTIEVTEAKSAWLEVLDEEAGESANGSFTVVAHKNIDPQEIEIMSNSEGGIRGYIVDAKKVIVIDEFTNDKRTRHLSRAVKNIGSLIGVPLISQETMIGILYAAKNIEYGFDQEDADLVATFADHVSIAIENSRLIEESLERERLQQELMVAQKVQRRLLPEYLPKIEGFDMDAFSSLAYEVGGDYYDIAMLDENRMGIVVGDVSGKGVSAAFYMAELKGIFQALSRTSYSAREFLIRANRALYGSIDKSSFISLIYSIIEVKRGIARLARAGHCPMIHVSGEHAELHKPNGIGLGLTGSDLFDDVIQETSITLEQNDVCVFYTDGITEARNASREEFGSDRLVSVILENRHKTARNIREAVLNSVNLFTERQTFDDDLTIVILKRNPDLRAA
jgi:phosphoserine phosphatase RsbU/P